MPHNQRKQRGAALAVSLIILLVMTLLVLSSSQNVVMQERMTSAVRDSHISLAAAEAAIAAAENEIEDMTENTVFLSSDSQTGVGGYWQNGYAPTDLMNGINWSNANYYRSSNEIDGVTAQYVIMHLGTLMVDAMPTNGVTDLTSTTYGATTGEGEIDVFQIVARATGASGNAERMVTTNFGKLF